MKSLKLKVLPAGRHGKSWHKAGFTLIELLVVISIIGILAALTLTGFNAARKNARDVTRKSDLQQYRSALESYASNNNGKYPTGDGESVNNNGIFGPTSLIINEYLPSEIADPNEGQFGCDNNTCAYWYRVSTDLTEYTLHARLETGGIWQICSDGRANKVNCDFVSCGDADCDL